MLNLTKEERRIIIFSLALLLIGSGSNYFRTLFPASPLDMPAHNKDYAAEAVKPVNINTANFNELLKLKGIGPKTAERIIEYRNLNGSFFCIEDIQNVKGIGPKKFRAIKEYIRTE